MNNNTITTQSNDSVINSRKTRSKPTRLSSTTNLIVCEMKITNLKTTNNIIKHQSKNGFNSVIASHKLFRILNHLQLITCN